QRAAGNQAVVRLLSEGGAGESFGGLPVGWSGAQRSMRVGNGAVVSVFPSARPIFRLVEGGAGQIQREGDDEIPQDMKLGGSALSSAVTRLYYAMSPILALPGKAKAIALDTT